MTPSVDPPSGSRRAVGQTHTLFLHQNKRHTSVGWMDRIKGLRCGVCATRFSFPFSFPPTPIHALPRFLCAHKTRHDVHPGRWMCVPSDRRGKKRPKREQACPQLVRSRAPSRGVGLFPSPSPFPSPPTHITPPHAGPRPHPRRPRRARPARRGGGRAARRAARRRGRRLPLLPRPPAGRRERPAEDHYEGGGGGQRGAGGRAAGESGERGRMGRERGSRCARGAFCPGRAALAAAVLHARVAQTVSQD